MPLRVDECAPAATEDYFRVLAERARIAGEAGSYLPPELERELLDRFSRSRDRLDGELGSKGVLDFAAAAANAGCRAAD